MIQFHDKDVEFSVLCAATTNYDALLEVMELGEDEFYDNTNKIFFKALKELYKTNGKVDLVTLKDQFVRMGRFDDLGGYEWFDAVAKSYHIVNVKEVIKIIRDYSRRRSLYMILDKAKTTTETLNVPNDEIIDDLQKSMVDITDIKNSSFETYKSSVDEDLSKFLVFDYVKSGITDIDEKMIGFFGGEFNIIASRPGEGKTTLGLQIASNIARDHEVLFFSLEMPTKQLALKSISREARVDSHKIRKGQLSDQEYNRIQECVKHLKKLNITFVPFCFSLTKILNLINKFRRMKKVGAIFIDYVQLIEVRSKSPRYEQVGQITRELKRTAGELDVPVIGMAQLSRAAEDRPPTLADLRESGNIEQDADTVMFIYKKLKEKEGPGQNISNISFAKARNGKTGYGKLRFNKPFSVFESIADERFEKVLNAMGYLHD